MDSLDGTSLNNSNSTVNLGSDLGPLGDDALPSARASWDQAAAGAGLNQGDGTDDMGWGGTADRIPAITVRADATGDGASSPGNTASDAAGHEEATSAAATTESYKSFWQKAEDFLTDPHTALGAASFAPSLLGSAASAADGLLYAAQGKYADAGISLGAAAVGVVSDAGAARLAAKGIKAGAEALTAGHAGETAARAVETGRAGEAGSTVAHAAEEVADADKTVGAGKTAAHGTEAARFGRTEAEYESLAKDPAHGGKIDAKSEQERRVGLELEERKAVPATITRDPTGAAEFIDGAGQKWDVKGFNSNFKPSKGGFDVQVDAGKVDKSLKAGEHVMLDTSKMTPNDIAALKAEGAARSWGNKVVYWP